MERRIETERLILRPIGVEDAPAVFVWASDPEVNRYMSIRCIAIFPRRKRGSPRSARRIWNSASTAKKMAC
ncbi:MAG: GNAT family N-acetyltransferase [Oscillospiraceae bacterium]